MVNDTYTEYEKLVTKLVSEGKRTGHTVPFVVRHLTPMEWAQRINASQEEKVKRKYKLNLKVKDAVPLGPYPCYLSNKGVGWCQVTIQEKSAELKYRIFGMSQIALTVEVISCRSDGKVQIWAQAEEYDPADMTMKL